MCKNKKLRFFLILTLVVRLNRRDAPDDGSRVYPGKKKFKMFNGKDSDMLVVIVGQLVMCTNKLIAEQYNF